jgi:hypothetical protein
VSAQPEAALALAPLVQAFRSLHIRFFLEWFRKGDEVSERQWKDVLGVLRVGEGSLDLAYMDRWASGLGITDLLKKALAEAGLPA